MRNIHCIDFDIDDQGTPLGIVGIKGNGLCGLSFFYDQQSLLEGLSSEPLRSLDQGVRRDFSQKVESSILPRVHSFREPLIIPGFAGDSLARAFSVFSIASDQRYAPYTSWPVIDQHLPYEYILYYPDTDYCGDMYSHFNSSFARVEEGCDPIVTIVYSKEQYFNLLRDGCMLDAEDKALISNLIKSSIMPEESLNMMLELSPGLSKVVYRFMSYSYNTSSLCREYANSIDQLDFSRYHYDWN